MLDDVETVAFTEVLTIGVWHEWLSGGLLIISMLKTRWNGEGFPQNPNWKLMKLLRSYAKWRQRGNVRS